ncbi:hypothetical protein ES705_33995 [subsurface metagenome]
MKYEHLVPALSAVLTITCVSKSALVFVTTVGEAQSGSSFTALI